MPKLPPTTASDMADAEYDRCDDAADAATEIERRTEVTVDSDPNPLADEAVFTTAVLAEEAALEAEALALNIGCTASVSETASSMLANFTEYTAQLAEQASEQAEQAKKYVRSNLLLAYAAVADLASETLRHLSENAEKTEENAMQTADAAATAAAEFAQIARKAKP